MDDHSRAERATARTSKRRWPLSGRPPSPRLICLSALAFTLVANWQSRHELAEPTSLWRDSRLAYAIALLGGTAVLSLFLYIFLRLALPAMKPRVTTRWRRMPLVFRTVSLVESIVAFQLFRAIPWMLLGVGLGASLSLVGGWIGIVASPAPSWMFLQAFICLAAGLSSWLALRQAAKSSYEMPLRIW